MSRSDADEHELPGADGPRLGGLLRLASAQVHDAMLERLRSAGFDDITRATYPIFFFPSPHGTRPADVARKVGISRQALNNVLARVEESGYLERRPAAEGGRPLLWLTAKGRAVTQVLSECSTDLEQELVRAVGRDVVEAMFVALRHLSATPPAADRDLSAT